MTRHKVSMAMHRAANEWLRKLGTGVGDEYARVLGSDTALIARLRELEREYRKRIDSAPGPGAA